MHFVLSIIACVGGVILAVLASGALANAFAQTHRAKSAIRAGDNRVTDDRLPVTGQNFWMQTNGPQGGDGIALATNSSGDVFVGTQGGGVFRSTDNGDTWAGINNGLTATNVRALAINPAGHVFAGTFGGAFRSTDNGDTWVAVNNGLDFPFVISLAINPSGDVFAGAFGQAWEKIRFSLEPQAVEMAFTVPLIMATAGRLLITD